MIFDLTRSNYDIAFFQETLVSDHRQIKTLSDRWSKPSFWSPALGKQGGVAPYFTPPLRVNASRGAGIQVVEPLVS